MAKRHILVKDFIKIGKIISTKAYSGLLKVVTNDEDPPFREGEYLFLLIDGLPVPYLVEKLIFQSHILLKLKGIETMEKAKSLVGVNILKHFDELDFEYEKGDFNFSYLEGFTLRHGDVESAVIVKVEQFPSQIMATVIHEGKEKYVPLAPQLIKEIDKEGRLIFMDLPDNLL